MVKDEPLNVDVGRVESEDLGTLSCSVQEEWGWEQMWMK